MEHPENHGMACNDAFDDIDDVAANDIELGEIIGNGWFGCVYRGALRSRAVSKNLYSDVAVKVLGKDQANKAAIDREKVRQKAEALKELKHKYIIRIFGKTRSQICQKLTIFIFACRRLRSAYNNIF